MLHRGIVFAMSFLIGIVGFGLLAERGTKAMRRYLDATTAEQKSNGMKTLARTALAADLMPLTDVKIARERGQFVVTTINGSQLSFDVLKNQDAFAQTFPGYAATVVTHPIWRTYFTRFFTDPNVWVPILAVPAQAYLSGNVATSWLGSLDLFEQFGADVALFGTSEVSTNLIPYALSSRLKSLSHGGVGPSVLGIGGIGQYAPVVRLTATAMVQSKKRAKLAIWGFSFWDAYLESIWRHPTTIGKLNDYHTKYPQGELTPFEMPVDLEAPPPPEMTFKSSFWRKKLSDVFPAVTWAKIFPHSAEATKKNSLRLWWDVITQPAASQLDLEEGYRVRLDTINNEEALREAAARTYPHYPYLDGSSVATCDMTTAARIYNATVDELAKAADDVVIYIPPVMPKLLATLPECYLPKLKAILESRASQHIKVITEDWSYYGLGYRDYVYPSELAGFASVNINHPNYLGAQKVTAKLGTEIENWLRSGLK